MKSQAYKFSKNATKPTKLRISMRNTITDSNVQNNAMRTTAF